MTNMKQRLPCFQSAGHPGRPSRTLRPLSAQPRGIALVVLLGMLVLVTGLVVAFLSSVSTELQSAKSYASGTDARVLADSAVNIVISQVQDATADAQLAWASQPGMIRTYDAEGKPAAAYKLYSSDVLRVSGGFDPVANLLSEVPPDWAEKPAVFTDLNRPVTVNGVRHYPIINPAAFAKDKSGGDPIDPDSGSEPIEGAFVDTSNPALASAGQNNPIPMPVQWMYVLQDGKVASVDPATGKVPDASEGNPIVGRIAFWTDDETSKVNVNTASEGTFWDRPWTEGGIVNGTIPNATSETFERVLALNMPAHNEFQRYPGHPAMTSLSTIFPRLPGESVPEYNARIYGIIPRVSDRDQFGNPTGSLSNTRNVNQDTKPIVPDGDRLFASVDEFLFGISSTGTRPVNKKSQSAEFEEQDIEKARFFITAHSRAPEVNLFNKPRITLWPLQIDPDPDSGARTRTAQDHLIAFASTIGDKPYYFQRYNTYTSGTNPTKTPLEKLSSQHPTMDWEKIERNRELYAYLQFLTSRDIPGLGGKFSEKYPRTRDQILTQMWDYIRSGVNTFGTREDPHYAYTPFNPSGFDVAQSQIVPLVLPNKTKGFGRFSTITEAAIIFYRKDALKVSGTMPAGGYMLLGSDDTKRIYYDEGHVFNEYELPDIPEGTAQVVLSGTNYTLSTDTGPAEIGAVLILEPFNPTPGPPPWSGHYHFVIEGMDKLLADGKPMGFPAYMVNYVNSLDTQTNASALTGIETFFQKHPRNPKVLGHPADAYQPDENLYPFHTTFQVTGTSTFKFTGADITIKIYPGAYKPPLTNVDPIQTIHMSFPNAATSNPDHTEIPIPTLGIRTITTRQGDTVTVIPVPNRKYDTLRDFDRRLDIKRDPNKSWWGIAEHGKHTPLPLIVASTSEPNVGDTVRSVEARYGGPARGDLRLFAGLIEVPEDFFEGHGMKDPPKDSASWWNWPSTPKVSNPRIYKDSNVASRLVHSLWLHGLGGDDTGNSNGYYAGAGRSGDPRGKLLANVSYNDPNHGSSSRNRRVPVVPRGLDEARMANGLLGDWDTGYGAHPDGPFINVADQATATRGGTGSTATFSVYYTAGGQYVGQHVVDLFGSSYSPNRQIASAVSFGSLPTGIDQTDPSQSDPWRTLLFTKHPLAGDEHPGFGAPKTGPPYTSPPDHAFLDLFTMPIVEPYPISEPFSTAGKVNMNYQIVPFTYVTRSTAMRAVLKATNLMAIPQTDGLIYKWQSDKSYIPTNYRFTLNPDEQDGTLAGFEERFAKGDIFRSASEICDISLVPQQRVYTEDPPLDVTYDMMPQWWQDYQLTGDNVREQPYGHIYPRITTKSNTYTVHVTAQSLKKVAGTPPDGFVEDRDVVTGEFRGSYIIERYLDPNSDSLVDGTGQPTDELDPEGMVGPYKFRVVSTKRFAP
jgi:uncharacterized protein (TIGR02600 family)